MADAATTLSNTTLSQDAVWTKAGSPYIITGVTISSGKTLTIEPGTIVKLRGILALYSFGTLNIGSEDGEQVTVTSYRDDTVGGDTNNDGGATVPTKSDWCSIGVHTSAITNITNTSIHYGGCTSYGQIYNFGGTITISHSKFSDSGQYAIFAAGGTTSVTSSEITQNVSGVRYHNGTIVLKSNSIYGNTEYGVLNTSLAHTVVDATGNWWGSDKGPFHSTNPSGIGNNAVSNYVTFDPWLGRDPLLEIDLCVENCFSNVLFLPGIKTSRLYTDKAGEEDELWVPNFFGDDVENLFLDDSGKSINPVYTKEGDILEETPVGGNIYKSFLANLASLKASQTINDYSAFSYDWRQSVEDIAQNGTPYQGEVRSATETLEGLSNTSKSNKVTIIAHSNGGLLAKAIMLELEKRGEGDMVDKIVFVGSPQMGTPLSILSALYGYDESLAFDRLVSQNDARKLIENMPGAYGLLPSAEYFSRITDPFITFSSENTWFKDFKDAYGEKIQSHDEFKRFLLGTDDGRSKPAASDVEKENILNSSILQEASNMHARLDAWAPPLNVEVVEIAGWGLDTVSGIKYTEKEKTSCSGTGKNRSCSGTGEYEPIYDPVFTVDGDKVVVTPSALMLPNSSNVKRYWVDLYSNNKGLRVDREHKDLFEVNSLREFLFAVITNNTSEISLPSFIKSSRPVDFEGSSSRLRMSLYSPLDIHLYDSQGNHTGPKTIVVDGQETTIFEEGIPNSYYFQFGDRKYVGFDESESIRIKMEGYAEGSYTLKLEEVNITETGDEVLAHTVFENLPTTPETEVTLEISESGLSGMSNLEADTDGDGMVDYELVPVYNGSVTIVPDRVTPITSASLSGTEGTNDWYVGDVAVALEAEDNEGGRGLDKTEYSLDSGVSWQEYKEPFLLSQEGLIEVLYTSTDKAGNREETRTLIAKIDKTAPEAKLQFDPASEHFGITGVDNLSSVSVVGTAATATLTDEAGHILTLSFSKVKDKERKVTRTLDSLSYDGNVVPVTDTSLKYKWLIDKRQGTYKMLAAHLGSEGSKVESHYSPKNNMTFIMEKPEDLDDSDSDELFSGRTIKQKLVGIVVPYIQTEEGGVKIKY